jgi:hypothetical protein
MTNKNISSADVNPGKKLTGKQWGAVQFKEALDQLNAASEECDFEALTQEDAAILDLFAQRLQSVTSKLYLTCKPDTRH